MSRALSSWFTELQVYTTHLGVNKLGFSLPFKKIRGDIYFLKKYWTLKLSHIHYSLFMACFLFFSPMPKFSVVIQFL